MLKWKNHYAMMILLSEVEENVMHFGAILTADMANGPGIRLSLFVSGCTNQCKGCFQPETWDFCYGKEYTKEVEDYLITEVSQSYYQGLTILGGEPFEPSNQEVIVQLIRRMRKECPDKDIWIYSGFNYETDLRAGGCRYTEVTDEILDSIDVLVDGRFEEELKSLRLNFRGSSNQRIIDMVETRKQGRVILSGLNN